MGQGGGFSKRPGGSSLVQDAARSGSPDTPGKRTLVEQQQQAGGGAVSPAAPVDANVARVAADVGGTRALDAVQAPAASVHLARDKQQPASAPASQASGLGDWVGAGPAQDALAIARHTIARLETVISHSATGYEGTDLLMHLGAMRQHLHKLLRDAELATPADKGSGITRSMACRRSARPWVGWSSP